MFKRTLPVGMILVFVLIALVSLGVVYGAWTQTLTIGGTAKTGTFDVAFLPAWYDDTYGVSEQCKAAVTNNGHDLTVTITNAFPGYFCEGGASITNLSSIPAKINVYNKVADSMPPAFWQFYQTDAAGAQVASGGYTLAAGANGGGVYWSFAIPATETGHKGETYTFTYTILAEQAVP